MISNHVHDAAAEEFPAILPLKQAALFLDCDGTIADIAAQPDDAIIDRCTTRTLQILQGKLQGALAIVSGRDLASLDRMLSPCRFDAAGLYGMELRTGDSEVWQVLEPRALFELQATLGAFVAQDPRLLLEKKTHTMALHWRQAPDREKEALALLDRLAKKCGAGYQLMLGKYAGEIVPAGIGKAQAINRLMSLAPYAGRRPVFIGDDAADEAGFSAVNAAGGMSFKVGGGTTDAFWRLGSPEAVRMLLTAAARTGDLDSRQADVLRK